MSGTARTGTARTGTARTGTARLAVLFLILGLGAVASGCGTGVPADPGVTELSMEVVATVAHDPGSFTQGLVYSRGRLFESSGLYGQSTVRELDPSTGRVITKVPLESRFFGEGLALRPDGRLVQLTWKEHVAFVRDRTTLAEVGRLPYEGEGWGLCLDETRGRMVMSNGSSSLTFRDPDTFAVEGTVTVTRDGTPVERINELECVGDKVWANVWQTDEILRIDISSGKVTGVVDASGLLTPAQRAGTDVLNGIAFKPDTGTFLVTGKDWPSMFEVRFSG